MRRLTALILFVLALCQTPAGQDALPELTARAIRENRPSVCEQAIESCYSNDFESICTPASANRFMCYRSYAFAKNDFSICEKIKGESNIGHSYRDVCIEHYAQEKKDISVCEQLKTEVWTNKILYADCIETVQERRDNYLLDECLKIKDLGEPYTFAKCIAGVARQTKDLPLCSRIFSESTIVDFWGNTLLHRCETQAQIQK